MLAGLRAPHGVFGCLGNHEAEVGIEESITRLFSAQGIRILRQERSLIKRGDAMLNLVGVDNTDPDRILATVKGLVIPGTVNILLEHYPGLFDYGLGIDLTLAGDIHGGGQLSLDFVRPGLNLSGLVGYPTSEAATKTVARNST